MSAGMAEAPVVSDPGPRQRPRRASGFPADFGAANPENMGTWWQHARRPAAGPSAEYRTESDKIAAEKKRRDEAMDDAILRGLDAEERAKAARAAAARERVAAALARAQQLAAELEAQQDTLRNANAELEEQTAQLKLSDQKMKAQQSEPVGGSRLCCARQKKDSEL